MPFTDKPDYEGAAKEAIAQGERKDYKGFKMPGGMSTDQSGRWKSAIDERESEKTQELLAGAPSALSVKSFGVPGGALPPTTGEPELLKPVEGATPSDIAYRALEVASMSPVGQVAQAAADVGVAGMDLAKGDYLGAGISAAAVGLPVTAFTLKRLTKSMRPSAAKEIAESVESVGTAGTRAEHPATQTLAAQEWAEKGTDSPFFRMWSEHPVVGPDDIRVSQRDPLLPGKDPPLLHHSTEDRNFILADRFWYGARGHSILGGWGEKAAVRKHHAGQFLREVSNRGGKPREITRLDLIAAQPTTWRLQHATRGFQGDAIDVRESVDLGFHMGTEHAASDRAIGVSGGVGSSGPETLDLFFKSKNLVPLHDGWDGADILEEAINHASRTGNKKGERALRELAGSSIVRQRYKDDSPKVLYRAIRNRLQESGYDGAVYVNSVEGPGSLSFIAFSRDSVKLGAPSKALGPVRGTFDPIDPRLAWGVGAPAAIGLREKAREEKE